MPQHTSRRIRSRHHWPLQVLWLPATRQPHPAATETVAAPAGGAPSTDADFEGELATAPWIGLHYVSEAL